MLFNVKYLFRYFNYKAILILVLFIFSLCSNTFGQYTSVKSINGQTEDGLYIKIWVQKKRIKKGKPIVVYFKITNFSSKNIYLVFDKKSHISVDRNVIAISAPVVDLSGHSGYNYNFLRVPIKKSEEGKLIISPEEYNDPDTWNLLVGFGYVTNIKGLSQKNEIQKNPFPALGLLQSRLKIFGLGYLIVEVMS